MSEYLCHSSSLGADLVNEVKQVEAAHSEDTFILATAMNT